MKKRIAILALFSFFMLSSLASCGSNSKSGDNTNVNNNEESVTLSNDEEKVYNAVAGALTAFKDPGSVIVIDVDKKPLIGDRYLKISAKNSYGGRVTNIYQVTNSGSLRGPVTDYNNFSSDLSISVDKINKKLATYKTSMGWVS